MTEAPTPAPAVSAGARPSRWTAARLSAVLTYTLRSCIGPRKWLAGLLPCVAALLFGLLAHAIDDPSQEAFAWVAAEGIFALVVPIASLMIGDAALGAEVRSGVLHFTWLTPTPLGLIVVGRWLGGCIAACATLVPACVLAALVAGVPEAAGPAALAAATGAMAYIAVFVAFGCVARRAAVWSLAFVFLVERLLGTALSGIAQWSPMWESRAVYADLADGVPDDLIRDGIPVGTGAVVRLCLIAAIALVVSRWRLAHLKLAGAAD